MGGFDSNIGKAGPDSIRINGMKPENLPIAEAARVQPQMAEARENERQNVIAGIRKKYPTQDVGYLEGRIKECRTSMDGMHEMMLREQQRIQEYQGHIEMCKHRDRMLAQLDSRLRKGEIGRTDYLAEQKALKLQFPYVIDRLEEQVRISNESIERFQSVVKRETHDIEELNQVLALCRQRDAELKAVK
jgi:hypothetical protein